MTTTRHDDPVAARRSPLRSVAGFSVRHRWLVIIGWLLLVAMAVLGKNLAGGSFANDLSVSGTDSQAAHETMQAQFPSLSGDPMQVVIRTDRGLEDPTVRPVVESALADIAAGPDVAVVTSPYRPGGTVSDGRHRCDRDGRVRPDRQGHPAHLGRGGPGGGTGDRRRGGPGGVRRSGGDGRVRAQRQRGHRPDRGHDRAPARLRLALRHGRADPDGPVRPRLRPVGRGAAVRVDPDRDLRTGRRGDDRARRRDRLRAADRDPAPGGDVHRPRAAGVDPRPRSARPGARSWWRVPP